MWVREGDEVRYCEGPKCYNVARPGRVLCYKCTSRRYRETHPEKDAYWHLKSNARRRRIGFELTFEEWMQFLQEHPEYMARRGLDAESLTIDRIRAWEPYKAGNLQVLSRADNSKKARQERKNWPSWPKSEPDPNVPF